MPRYIDADKLKSTLKNLPQWGGEVLLLSVLNTVDRQFTADVAPRAEVAREIILEVDALICCHANGDINDRRLYLLFDELKKKYAEKR